MTALLRLLLISLALVLTACGGGSGGGGSTPVDEPPGDGDPDDGDPGDGGPGDDPEPAGTARAAGGVIGDGLVTISGWNGADWVQLELTSTDANGYFALNIPPQAGPVRIVVSGDSGSTLRCELPAGCGSTLFGDDLPLPEGLTLSAIVPGDLLDEDTTLAVTPLTHLAALWTQGMPRGASNVGAELALARVALLLDLDADFAFQAPIDLSDSAQTDAASPQALRQALFAAALSALAADESLPVPAVLDGAGQMFALLGGQMLVPAVAPDIDALAAQLADYGLDPTEWLAELDDVTLSLPGFESLVAAAVDLAGALGTEVVPASVASALPDLLLPWNAALVTSVTGEARYDSAALNSALVPLDDYDHYRALAQAAADGIDAELRGLGWLYRDDISRDDTAALVGLLAEVLGFAIDAAICVPERKNGITSCDVDPPYATLIRTQSSFGFWLDGYLQVQGSRDGHAVDLAVSAKDIRDLLRQGQMPITIEGTLSSDTALTTLDIRLDLDITDNDLSGFQALSNTQFGDAALLNPLLEDLAADLSIEITLSGSGSIASTDAAVGSYSFSNLDSLLHFNRRVLTQDEEAPLMILALDGGSRETPSGETLYTLSGEQGFSLFVDDPFSLAINYGTERLGLPSMEVRLGATLEGYTSLLNALGDYITAVLDGEEGELPDIDLEALLDGIDTSLLAGDGTAELRILDPSAGTRDYRFSSDALGLHISQPDSTDTALTFTLGGLTGYLYDAEDLLVATLHPGTLDSGLLINLIDGGQRSYVATDTGRMDMLENLLLFLEGLFGPLFETEPEAT
ncbi:hypothetical protein K8B33_09935 [Alcanivorax sp. JB21]|uniref:hypothetical protein n=1 Tax=Alcanivorax limicola TaxID=2874102 RepID=UPI001CBA7507|nr:hypothetical protein [Alcanivorax limicola]MBZ2189416.1 hypothetical protein [Alcanivorax limicola]